MILKRFNVERIATDEALIKELKKEGFVEVEQPKKAKKAPTKKGEKNADE